MENRSAGLIEDRPYRCVFDRFWPCVVVGSGYAGFAAAAHLHKRGIDTLLVSLQGDLLWESGRAFAAAAGSSESTEWAEFMDRLRAAGGFDESSIDGAIAEVEANHQVLASGLPLLSYAIPVAVESDGAGLSSIIVATKAGLRRIAGGQFIDATEEAILLRLADVDLPEFRPDHHEISLFFQRAHWPKPFAPERTGAMSWLPTLWDRERRLKVSFHEPVPVVSRVLLGAIEEAWQQHRPILETAQLSHASTVPFPVYTQTRPSLPLNPPGNLRYAVAGLAPVPVETLADRFGLGLDAARGIPTPDNTGGRLPTSTPPVAVPRQTRTCDVLVAGLGTGGSIAAIAAGRILGKDHRVLGIEPAPALGGAGTAGGIHGYWFGVPGGLQDAIDRRTHALMDGFGGLFAAERFNPEAKKIALCEQLDKAGVEILTGALLYDVEVSAGRVRAAHVATPKGAVRFEAESWIDGTGDGDLCERAGAKFTFGRSADGQPGPYSQSGGHLTTDDDGNPRIAIVNFDAGWCDPTDPEDITRARLLGIDHYWCERYDDATRPTWIAPLIGIRQSRQVETDLRLELADLAAGRAFPDTIGYSGCHVDTHDVDHLFEEDDVAFWIWALNRPGNVGASIPYRLLLPRGLDNVWIASRCVGLSQGAHFSLRMQRDIQRVGEAAGVAAAEAVLTGTDSRSVDFSHIRRHLEASGALELGDRSGRRRDGPVFDTAFYGKMAATDVDAAAGDALASGKPDIALFLYWRRHNKPTEAVLNAVESDEPKPRFLAACLLAMWGDERAEPELLRVLRESWEEPGDDPVDSARSGGHPKAAPSWLVALTLLRRCGTGDALSEMLRWSENPGRLTLHVRAAWLLTMEALVQRGYGPEARQRVQIEAAIGRLLDTPAPGAIYQNPPVHIPFVQAVFRGEREAILERNPRRSGERTAENHQWQLVFAACRARQAMALPIAQLAEAYVYDYRAIVRRAFARLLKNQPVRLSIRGQEREKVAIARSTDG